MKRINTHKAVKILEGGGVVVFPTDTVWGIGAFVESKKAIEKLYRIKKRDTDKPTALLVGSVDQAKKYGDFDEEALRMVSKNWPGALTVITKAIVSLDDRLISKEGGVGIRYADSREVEKMCLLLGGGIVASSANFSGKTPPRKLSEISKKIIEMVDGVVESNKKGSGKSSTVVSLIGEKMKILRQGDVWL